MVQRAGWDGPRIDPFFLQATLWCAAHFQVLSVINDYYGDVSLVIPLPPQEPTHHFQPGDLVFVR